MVFRTNIFRKLSLGAPGKSPFGNLRFLFRTPFHVIPPSLGCFCLIARRKRCRLQSKPHQFGRGPRKKQTSGDVLRLKLPWTNTLQ